MSDKSFSWTDSRAKSWTKLLAGQNFRYINLKRSTEGWISVNGTVPIELPETIRFNSDVAFFARDDNEGSPGNIIQLPRRGKSWII